MEWALRFFIVGVEFLLLLLHRMFATAFPLWTNNYLSLFQTDWIDKLLYASFLQLSEKFSKPNVATNEIASQFAPYDRICVRKSENEESFCDCSFEPHCLSPFARNSCLFEIGQWKWHYNLIRDWTKWRERTEKEKENCASEPTKLWFWNDVNKTLVDCQLIWNEWTLVNVFNQIPNAALMSHTLKMADLFPFILQISKSDNSYKIKMI